MVSDNVSRDCVSAAVSVPAVLFVKSPTALVNEYGDAVLVMGMVSEARIVPAPAGSRVSILAPSMVPVRMCAVVAEPRRTLLSRVKVTSALP